jgi:hypothetical protein
MHPLAGDLSVFKDGEIENKINELTRKYFQSHNAEMQHQIVSMLETYKSEMATRRHAEWQKMMENRDKNLDKLINVQ